MLFDKIDIRPIIRGHFATLRDNAFGSRTSREDLILFIGFPVILGCVVTGIGFRFRLDAVNGFLNVFAILTGLLLNVLVLVLTLLAGKTPEAVDPKRRSRLANEMFVNISYAVLIAVVVVCSALVSLSYMRSVPNSTTGPIATFILTGLTLNFVLTLLMVLKRMYVLIDKDLKSEHQSKAA